MTSAEALPGSSSMTNNNAPANLDDPANVRRWLQANHPKQLALLDKFQIDLRLGRFASSRDGGKGSSSGDQVGNIGSNSSTHQTYQYGKERRLVTSHTVELLRSIIGPTRWKTAAQLLTLLRGLGNELHDAGGYREPAIGNMVRRVMFIVRDEADNVPSGVVGGDADNNNKNMEKIDELSAQVSSKLRMSPSSTSAPGRGKELSLASMLWAHPQHVTMKHSRQQSGEGISDMRIRSDSFGSTDTCTVNVTSSNSFGCDPAATQIYPPHYYMQRDGLRQSVMEAIEEVRGELEDLHKNINDQATQHIHNGEIILTYAFSSTVEWFLKTAAAKKRKFQVIVCEGAPHFGGHVLAKSLAEAGIDTTVIHDAAIFAIMARVNKVLLPAHAVLANGGLVAPSGCNIVALAAKQNSVPVVAVAGMFKLCPLYPHEGQDTLNDLISPSSVVDYSLMGDPVLSEVEFVNPVHDYITPQLIDLYVTNIGGFQPSYIYRLLAEYYHSDDWD
jgi:translation initiation factor eIF-2B subunit beta